MLKKLVAIAIATAFASGAFAAGGISTHPTASKSGKIHHTKAVKHQQHRHAQSHYHQHMASAR